MSDQFRIFLSAETEAFLSATGELMAAFRHALSKVDPQLYGLFTGRALRIIYDSGERVLLVSLVDDHGQSVPMMGINADPGNVTTFGEVGVPVIVSGLYDRHTQAH